MKPILATTLLLCALTPGVSMADTSVPAPSCTTRDTTYDSRDVTCTLAPAAAGRPLQFKADFSGGHDDTMASMTVLLDDKPLACEGGGKLRLMGEDGNVSLHCRFAGPSTPGVLRATIRWSHAEYVGAGMTVD